MKVKVKVEFLQLKVSDFGSILYNALQNNEKGKDNAFEILSKLVKNYKEYKEHEKNSHGDEREIYSGNILTIIYPFYYLYRVENTDSVENTAEVTDENFLQEAADLIKGLNLPDIKPGGRDDDASSALNIQWNRWWDQLKKGETRGKINGKSINEILAMTLEEAIPKFEGSVGKEEELEDLWVKVMHDYTENADFTVCLEGKYQELEDYIKYINNTVKEVARWVGQNESQIILHGAPGTGKTYVATEVAKLLGGSFKNKDGEEQPGYKLIQFHPSYDYTDFVEGLRPIESCAENGDQAAISFKKVDGNFKRFCRKVIDEGDPEEKYFFIIDEINRADLSKVLGELMYGLERDKRGKKNRFETQYQYLKTYNPETGEDIEVELKKIGKEDCFKDGFYIPENIVIIGTMNDIDRSVESMDLAMRRRFVWLNMKVTEESLMSALSKILREECHAQLNSESLEAVVNDITVKVCAVNEYMVEQGKAFGLNEDYAISQGQFTGLPEDTYQFIVDGNLNKFMEKVWELRVEGLLKEYVRGEEAETFIQECENRFKGEQDK